jgi:5-methylthioadenosine/S-adenosylhomocysteine deaminase
MSASEPPFDILIRGATILTAEPERPAIAEGVIGISADRIAHVGPADAASPRLTGRKVIEAAGHLVTPGFVDTHTHMILTMAKGMTEDLGFAPAYTPGVPHGHDVGREEAIALARLGALELMLFGATLINDSYVHADATLPAMGELGLRVFACGRIHDVDFTRVGDGVWEHDDAIGDASLEEAHDLAERWNGAMDGRLGVQLVPHAPDTCTARLLREVRAARDATGLRVATHLAQSRLEVERVKARDGMTPAELLDEVGLLDERLIAAHCLIVTPDDIARLGRARINMAHPPKVNAMGGMRAPTSALRRAGVRVCVATDAMHGDMIEVMRWALAIGRVQEDGVNDFWQPRDVFEMSTIDPARAMGLGHLIGSIAPGKKADLVVIDLRRPHLAPALNPLGTLVHVAQGRDVRHVIVDGRVVVEDGRATLVDQEAIRRDGERAARALWERTGAPYLARVM